MKDIFSTLGEVSEGIYKEKGSKFIGRAIPVEDEASIKEKLEEIRKAHHGARHHCFAYILGPEQQDFRINDDGEPSGTAGRPIFNQIVSKGLTDVLVVVSRYFGGTKLGASGLVNAYKTAAREALGNGKILRRSIQEVYELTYDYPETNEVMKILDDFQVRIIEQEFLADCRAIIGLRKKLARDFEKTIEKNKKLKIKHIKSEKHP